MGKKMYCLKTGEKKKKKKEKKKKKKKKKKNIRTPGKGDRGRGNSLHERGVEVDVIWGSGDNCVVTGYGVGGRVIGMGEEVGRVKIGKIASNKRKEQGGFSGKASEEVWDKSSSFLTSPGSEISRYKRGGLFV